MVTALLGIPFGDRVESGDINQSLLGPGQLKLRCSLHHKQTVVLTEHVFALVERLRRVIPTVRPRALPFVGILEWKGLFRRLPTNICLIYPLLGHRVL